MQELSRTLSLFLWPVTLAFVAFFGAWTTFLWVLDGDPDQFWPRVLALGVSLAVYWNVKTRIDTYLGPGLVNWALFPLRYVVAHLLALPFVALSSAICWRVLLLHLLPDWFFWAYLAVVVFWLWPWWSEHFLRVTFTAQAPPAFLARFLSRVTSNATPLAATASPSGGFSTPFGPLVRRVAAWAELRARDSERRIEHISGPKRLTPDDARRVALARPSVASERLGWTAPLAPEEGPLGLAALGAPGTGKSTLLQRLMASVLPRLGSDGDQRALLYDHKGEARALLTRFGIEPARIVFFHPFARETAVWAIARDLQHDTDIKEFTHVVLQGFEHYRADPFWIHAAEFVMQGVIKGLHTLRGDRWGLADLCRALKTKERIRQITKAAPGGEHRLAYMAESAHEKVFLSVLATLQAEFQDWEPIAKQWWWAERKHQARRYSLQDWIEGSDIVVLGHEEAHSRVFSAFQRAFFALAAKQVFDRSRHDESTHPERTWFFLDEAQNMERGLDALPRLVNSARSKGVCVVLGVQDLAGLEKLYPKTARSMLNGLSHWACFRTNNPDTAKWLADAFGKRRVREKLQRWDRHGVPQDTGERLLDEELVRPEELMAANQKATLRAFCKSENVGVWREELDKAALVARFGSPSWTERERAGPTPMPEFDRLPDWTPRQCRRLGLDTKEETDDQDDEDDYRPHPA